MEQAATVNRLCVQLLNDRVGPLSEQLRSIGELRREHHSAACEVIGLRNAALEACARAERLEQRLLDGARRKREASERRNVPLSAADEEAALDAFYADEEAR